MSVVDPNIDPKVAALLRNAQVRQHMPDGRPMTDEEKELAILNFERTARTERVNTAYNYLANPHLSKEMCDASNYSLNEDRDLARATRRAAFNVLKSYLESS